MERKILFFDIDNTLIERGMDVPSDSAKQALLAARNNGHILCINTGRTMKYVPPSLMELDFDGYVCGCGTFVSYRGETILHASLSHKDSLKIVQLFRNCKYQAVYEEKDGLYFDPLFLEDEFTVFFMEFARNLGHDADRLVTDPNFQIDKVYGCYYDNSDRVRFHDNIEGFDYFEHENGTFELVPSKYSKSTGMQIILDHLHMPVEDSYAFGDGTNDLPMLKFTPNSVVMGNGDKSIFGEAMFVTKSIDADGLAHALKTLGLI